MTEDTHTEMETADLLTRHAHLTELTVNRLAVDELTGAELAFAREHLEVCDPCGTRVEAVREFDASFSIAPPRSGSKGQRVVSLRSERSKRTSRLSKVGWVIMAAAAVLLTVVAQRPDDSATVVPGGVDDGIRLKGKGLSIEVFAKAEGGASRARAVGNGDLVHPGDRLGFKVTSATDGFLMVVGVDDSGQMYAGWPQHGGQAQFLSANKGPQDLESAVRLDDVGSRERIVLVRCAKEFDLQRVAEHLRPALGLRKRASEDPMRDCVYDEVSLTKKPR